MQSYAERVFSLLNDFNERQRSSLEDCNIETSVMLQYTYTVPIIIMHKIKGYFNENHKHNKGFDGNLFPKYLA